MTDYPTQSYFIDKERNAHENIIIMRDRSCVYWERKISKLDVNGEYQLVSTEVLIDKRC